MNLLSVLKCRRHQVGVGLIEVMISVLVLSVGLLGIAWVQTKALSMNSGAAARSMAVVASYNIMDAMRADILAARAGQYDTKVVADNCPSATDTLANTQIHDWCVLLGEILGAAATTTGKINCDNAGECEITIVYDDSRIGGGAGAETVVTRGIL